MLLLKCEKGIDIPMLNIHINNSNMLSENRFRQKTFFFFFTFQIKYRR